MLQKNAEQTAWGTNISFGKGSSSNVNVFTQIFFTDNAMHKQIRTSINLLIVITYPLINGKPFLTGKWDWRHN